MLFHLILNTVDKNQEVAKVFLKKNFEFKPYKKSIFFSLIFILLPLL